MATPKLKFPPSRINREIRRLRGLKRELRPFEQSLIDGTIRFGEYLRRQGTSRGGRPGQPKSEAHKKAISEAMKGNLNVYARWYPDQKNLRKNRQRNRKAA